MVELGNGDSFIFIFGPGCLRNIISMGHSQQLLQDIFITHLPVDHYHELSYLLPFSEVKLKPATVIQFHERIEFVRTIC
jgi:ribonuclease Z